MILLGQDLSPPVQIVCTSSVQYIMLDLRVIKTWDQIPPEIPTSSVTVGKLYSLTNLQFPHLQNEGIGLVTSNVPSKSMILCKEFLSIFKRQVGRTGIGESVEMARSSQKIWPCEIHIHVFLKIKTKYFSFLKHVIFKTLSHVSVALYHLLSAFLSMTGEGNRILFPIDFLLKKHTRGILASNILI